MAGDKADEVSIGVTAFKARCLALIEAVAQGKTPPGSADQAQSGNRRNRPGRA
jgi:hypothetical protein